MADVRSGWRTRQGIYALAVVFVTVGAIVTSVAAYTHASGPTGGGSFDFAPSTTTKFLVFFDTAGSIPYWCIPHQAMGMTGTITVS